MFFMTDSLILIGGGGHCKACIDVIETTGLKIAGILDKESKGKILNYEVIGTDEALQALVKQQYSFLVTVGQVKSAALRKTLYQKIKEANGKAALVFSSKAIVSKSSSVGEGSIVMHYAIVNADSLIGSNCIINNKALIEHDCHIGNHTHVSTGALINGGCTIGEGVFIGSNAVIAHGVEITDHVIIGAGSVVLQNILQAGTYVGNPARKVK